MQAAGHHQLARLQLNALSQEQADPAGQQYTGLVHGLLQPLAACNATSGGLSCAQVAGVCLLHAMASWPLGQVPLRLLCLYPFCSQPVANDSAAGTA